MATAEATDQSNAIVSAALENEVYPAGHYYSPVPDFRWLKENAARVLVYDAESIPGVDLNEQTQLTTLKSLCRSAKSFDWPEKRSPTHRYFTDNPVFGEGSSAVLFAMMVAHRPKKIIEVGSGFSSALMLDTVEREEATASTSLIFIEPFPQRLNSLVKSDDRKRCRILVRMVQDVPLAEFKALDAGDILFIDSSHVARAASDVLFLYHQVLPALRPGVIVHIHDVYWPFEYPKSWLLKNKWAWNEVYFVRAFLQFNSAFEIILFNHFLNRRHRDKAREFFPVLAGDRPGGSLWLRRK